MKRRVLFLLTLLFGGVALLPILYLLGSSFWPGNAYAALFTPRTGQLLMKSITIGTSVSILATGLGLGIGFILSKSALPRKHLFRLLLLLPLFLPAYIITVAWVDFLLFLGLSTPLIYNEITVVFVLTIIYTPVAILIFSSALSHISASQEEAAWLMAPYPQVFFRIVLPLIKPALISSVLLIFLLAISEFTVPAFLSVSVLTTDIFIQFSAFYNYQAAIAQSSFLIVICLVGLIIERRLLGDKPFLTVTGRSHRNRLVLSPATNGITGSLLVIYLFLSTFIPLTFLTYQSLAHGFGDIQKAACSRLSGICISRFMSRRSAIKT